VEWKQRALVAARLAEDRCIPSSWGERFAPGGRSSVTLGVRGDVGVLAAAGGAARVRFGAGRDAANGGRLETFGFCSTGFGTLEGSAGGRQPAVGRWAATCGFGSAFLGRSACWASSGTASSSSSFIEASD